VYVRDRIGRQRNRREQLQSHNSQPAKAAFWIDAVHAESLGLFLGRRKRKMLKKLANQSKRTDI
jgi:hypothetical protein